MMNMKNVKSTTANESQLKAIQSNGSKILCLAGAGTGKTFTLIERIGRLVSEGHCQGENVLSLTFTNAAAFEMKERYAKKYSHLNSSLPEFRTFHAFCYSLLSSDIAIRTRMGYVASTPPQICDEHKMKEIQKRVKLQCNVNLSDAKLEHPELLSPPDKYLYEVFMKGLKKELGRQNLITFDMLCYDICKLFEDNDPIVQHYKSKYHYIFVDEFQDTDPKQWRFVKSFTNSHLFIVGDALQALYGFRNADSSIIKNLSRDPEWEVIKLYENYRSTKQICDFANNMSKYAGPTYRIEIQSTREGEPVYQEVVDDAGRFRNVSEDQLYHILADVEKLQGSTAILCRQNAEKSEVIDFLESADINVTTGKLYEEAIHIFESARDNDYLVSWLSTYLSDADYSDWLRVLSLSKCEDDVAKLRLFRDMTQSNKLVQGNMKKIAKLRNIMKSELTPQDKQTEIFKLLKVRKAKINQQVETNTEIADYIAEVLGTNTEADVYVGTIHSVKGLEYDNVILVGVDGFRFKLKDDEQMNCYYVGITRAKNWLKVYWAQNNIGGTKKYDRDKVNSRHAYDDFATFGDPVPMQKCKL